MANYNSTVSVVYRYNLLHLCPTPSSLPLQQKSSQFQQLQHQSSHYLHQNLDVQQSGQQSVANSQGDNSYSTRFTSINLPLPKFDGNDDVRSWIYKCERIFSLENTFEHMKVSQASFALEGRAWIWHQVWERKHSLKGLCSWDVFVKAIVDRFGLIFEVDGNTAKVECQNGVVKENEVCSGPKWENVEDRLKEIEKSLNFGESMRENGVQVIHGNEIDTKEHHLLPSSEMELCINEECSDNPLLGISTIDSFPMSFGITSNWDQVKKRGDCTSEYLMCGGDIKGTSRPKFEAILNEGVLAVPILRKNQEFGSLEMVAVHESFKLSEGKGTKVLSNLLKVVINKEISGGDALLLQRQYNFRNLMNDNYDGYEKEMRLEDMMPCEDDHLFLWHKWEISNLELSNFRVINDKQLSQEVHKIIERITFIIWGWFYKENEELMFEGLMEDLEKELAQSSSSCLHPGCWNVKWKIAWKIALLCNIEFKSDLEKKVELKIVKRKLRSKFETCNFGNMDIIQRADLKHEVWKSTLCRARCWKSLDQPGNNIEPWTWDLDLSIICKTWNVEDLNLGNIYIDDEKIGVEPASTSGIMGLYLEVTSNSIIHILVHNLATIYSSDIEENNDMAVEVHLSSKDISFQIQLYGNQSLLLKVHKFLSCFCEAIFTYIDACKDLSAITLTSFEPYATFINEFKVYHFAEKIMALGDKKLSHAAHKILEKVIVIIWNWFYKELYDSFNGKMKNLIHSGIWIKVLKAAWILEDKDRFKGEELIRSIS